MDIITKLSESLTNGEFLASAVTVLIVLIVNIKTIVEFLEDRKKAKAANLIEALKCDHITGLTKSHLEEELATEHFKLSTGIWLEKGFREDLIKAYREANGTVRFDHFKRALPHMEFRENTLSVHITWFDKIGVFVNCVCGLVMAIIAFPLMFLSYFGKGVTFTQFLSQFAMGAFFMGGAFFFFYLILPVVSARHVDGVLKKHEINANDAEGTDQECRRITS